MIHTVCGLVAGSQLINLVTGASLINFMFHIYFRKTQLLYHRQYAIYISNDSKSRYFIRPLYNRSSYFPLLTNC